MPNCALISNLASLNLYMLSRLAIGYIITELLLFCSRSAFFTTRGWYGSIAINFFSFWICSRYFYFDCYILANYFVLRRVSSSWFTSDSNLPWSGFSLKEYLIFWESIRKSFFSKEWKGLWKSCLFFSFIVSILLMNSYFLASAGSTDSKRISGSFYSSCMNSE